MLELKNVSKRYDAPGELVTAVNDVSLSVASAELVSVLGPSGSGKTTLLLIAAGIVAPDTGTVHFEGRDLAGMTDREAADYRLRTLGFVFQTPNLMPMTAIENVALPLIGSGTAVRAAVREVASLLAQVGLSDRAHHRPHELSGGERQRVAIARALAAEPRVVLADEPTGSLDTHRGEQILLLLRNLASERGVAVIVVTHDLRAAAHADRVCVMKDGGLTESSVDAAAAAGQFAAAARRA
jgi:ABC-type lipoprotein export system ATPase subunit